MTHKNKQSIMSRATTVVNFQQRPTTNERDIVVNDIIASSLTVGGLPVEGSEIEDLAITFTAPWGTPVINIRFVKTDDRVSMYFPAYNDNSTAGVGPPGIIINSTLLPVKYQPVAPVAFPISIADSNVFGSGTALFTAGFIVLYPGALGTVWANDNSLPNNVYGFVAEYRTA